MQPIAAPYTLSQLATTVLASITAEPGEWSPADLQADLDASGPDISGALSELTRAGLAHVEAHRCFPGPMPPRPPRESRPYAVKARVEAKLDNVAAWLDAVETRLGAIDDRLGAIRVSVARRDKAPAPPAAPAPAGDAAGKRPALTALSRRLARIEDRQDQIFALLHKQAAATGDLSARVEALAGTIGTLRFVTDAHRATVDAGTGIARRVFDVILRIERALAVRLPPPSFWLVPARPPAGAPRLSPPDQS